MTESRPTYQLFEIISLSKISNQLQPFIVSLMLCSLGAACNTNKYVAEEAYLYGGTQIEMAKTSTVKSPKKLSTALERYARPKKNSGLGFGFTTPSITLKRPMVSGIK